MMLYAIFPLVFKLFQNPLVRWTEILMTRWAGPCSLLLGFGLGGWLLGHFSPVWSTVDHQCCWALGLWWTTRVLDLVRGGLKK
jgi:hypothetical protein